MVGDATPVLVYFHGGGWTIGDLDTHDVLCRQLCLGAGIAVVSVDYRLGPEHRFPAAIDDALAAVRWVRREADLLGIDGRAWRSAATAPAATSPRCCRCCCATRARRCRHSSC